MAKELSLDSLSRVIGNSQARFLEGEGMATYLSLLDKKYGQMKSILFPQFKTNPLTGWQIKLPKLGLIQINLHRPIPEGFMVRQVRVIKKAIGWFVVITIESNLSIPEPVPHGRAIGIDVGLLVRLVKVARDNISNYLARCNLPSIGKGAILKPRQLYQPCRCKSYP